MEKPEEDEDEQETKTDEHKLEELIERKTELEMLVLAIEQNLRRHGYEFQKNDYQAPPLQPGIRINNELSFRGKQKAKELFERLDENNEGKLHFEDFRAMRSLSSPYGIAHDSVLSRWESWQMSMFDNSVEIDQSDATVNVDEFVRYRSRIESKVPLAPELVKSSLGYLPHLQRRWATIKQRIKEAFDRRGEDDELEFDASKLSLEEISYIAATSGLSFSKYEIQLAMCRIARFDNTMSHLLAKSLKRDLFLELPEDSTGEGTINGFKTATIVNPEFTISRENVSCVKTTTLSAWLMSNREDPRTAPFYKYLLRSKYMIWAGIRNLYNFSAYVWESGMHLRDRLVFKQQHVKPLEEVNLSKKTALKLTCEIGNIPQNGADGTNIYWKLSKIDHAIKYLLKVGIPKDCGTTIVLDFTYIPDTPHAEVVAVCALIKKEFMDHFGDEFRASQHFRGLFVFPSKNEADETPVLRVALAFRRAVSIDSFFTMLGIPYSLMDTVNHFYGEIATSVHILDIIETTTASLDISTYMMCTCFLEYNSEIVNTIIDTVRVAFAAGLTPAVIFGKKNKSGNPDQWAHIRPFFPIIVKFCDKMLQYSKFTKSCMVGLKYAKISELYEKLHASSEWLQRYIPTTIFTKIGALPPFYRASVKKLKSYYNDFFKIIKCDLEKKQDAREAERVRRRNLSVKEKYLEDQGKTKNELLNRLSALGVSAHEGELFADDNQSPEEYANIAKEKQLDQDAASFESIEKIKNILVGLHTCEVILGKAKLTVQCTGFEIFELLPPFPPMTKLREALDEREKKSLFEDECVQNEFVPQTPMRPISREVKKDESQSTS